MRIELGNIHATVIDASDDDYAWLYDYLSFEDSKSKFVRGRDGSVKFNANAKKLSMLQVDDTFPTGLVGKVKRAALKKGMHIPIIDRRAAPCVPLDWQAAVVNTALLVPDGKGGVKPWLHDFQQAAVDKAILKTRGILDMPTGAGKTETACGIAMRLGHTNTLFVAPEADLMHNAARRWEKRAGIESGRIGDGYLKPVDGFTAATFQTLAARIRSGDKDILEYLATVGCVIFDECHTLPADEFYRTAMQIPAYWRIGMSGTPLARGDRKSLFSIAATGSIIYKVETQLLIERGFIAKPHIQMIRHQQDFEASGWQAGERQGIVESASRNRLAVQLALNIPKPGLVFVKLKKHGILLEKMMKKAGLKAEFLWGEKNITQRDEAIKRLQDGDLDVIIASVIFQTGTDIPEVKSMVIACGGKSEIATLQRIGRGMRIVRDPETGEVLKDEFHVKDIFDTEPRQHAGQTGNRWNANHSRERFKAYAGVGHEVTMKDTP